MKNNQIYNCFNKLAKCKAATCVNFLIFILFLFVIVNPLNASDSGVSNLKMNKKYYLYLNQMTGEGPLIIRFNNNNTFHIRSMPEKPSLFNYIRAGRKEGVYIVCEDLLRLFWYEKFSRKKRLLYEVEAKIDEDYRIKAVSVKTKKC